MPESKINFHSVFGKAKSSIGTSSSKQENSLQENSFSRVDELQDEARQRVGTDVSKLKSQTMSPYLQNVGKGTIGQLDKREAILKAGTEIEQLLSDVLEATKTQTFVPPKLRMG